MRITLYSSPVVEVSRTAGFISHTTSPMDDVLPRESVEVADLPGILAAFEDYAERIKATGKPACISASFPKQAARKPRGFDAADLSRYINTEAMEAAAEAGR